MDPILIEVVWQSVIIFWLANYLFLTLFRCSSDITGQYLFRTKTGHIKKCEVQQDTHLYKSECMFIPDKKQTAPASIMYNQDLSSVSTAKTSKQRLYDLFYAMSIFKNIISLGFAKF